MSYAMLPKLSLFHRVNPKLVKPIFSSRMLFVVKVSVVWYGSLEYSIQFAKIDNLVKCDHLSENQPSSHLQLRPVKGLFEVPHTAQIFSNDNVMIYLLFLQISTLYVLPNKFYVTLK